MDERFSEGAGFLARISRISKSELQALFELREPELRGLAEYLRRYKELEIQMADDCWAER